MILWESVTSLIRVAIAVILIWKVHRFHDRFNSCERYGMVIAAGSSLLTVNVIWEGVRSPYEGWSSAAFSFGILLYFTGRASRHCAASRNNRAEIEVAE